MNKKEEKRGIEKGNKKEDEKKKGIELKKKKKRTEK